MSSQKQDTSGSKREASGIYFWYLLIFLLLAATMSHLDRQIPALMIGPIKRDLGINDTQVGLLLGLAFSIIFSAMLMPMAWLADTRSRRLIIGIGLFSWSLMTALSGLAGSFGQLFAARMGVGIGEAALQPAAYSLLADSVRKERLPFAIGVFAASTFVGIGLANILGGWLVGILEVIPPVHLPLIGDTRSWQLTFFIVGLPGIALALLALTLREPERSGIVAAPDAAGSTALLLGFFRENWLFFTLLFCGALCLAIQAWTLFGWVAEFFIRDHHMARADIGFSYGLIALLCGLPGSIVAGRLATSLIGRGLPDATLRVVAIGATIMWPLSIAMALVPSAQFALLLLAPVTFFMSWPPGLSIAAMQAISPNQIRGRVVAVYLILTSSLSIGFGPLLVGLINDYVFHSDAALGKTLAMMSAITYPLAALCFYFALKPLRRALVAAQQWD